MDTTAHQHELLPDVGRTDKTTSWSRRLILLGPLLLMGLFALMLAAPWTRPSALWLLRENHPVEIATALFLVSAGAASVARSRSTSARLSRRLPPAASARSVAR